MHVAFAADVVACSPVRLRERKREKREKRENNEDNDENYKKREKGTDENDCSRIQTPGLECDMVHSIAECFVHTPNSKFQE